MDGRTKSGHDRFGSVAASENMSPVERQQALSALLAAVMALFVASGYGPWARWRRRLRAAAVIVFLIALAAALAEAGFWLAGAQP